MSVPGRQKLSSLRLGRFEKKRLAWALVISLLIHLMGYGGYEFTRRVLPVWLERIKFLEALAHELQPRKPNPPPTQPTEPPLVFVEIPPEAATAEAPKDTKNYSSQNSKAANPEEADKDVAKISGQAPDTSKIDESARHLQTLHPNPAPQPKPEEAPRKDQQQEEAKARPKPPIGDLAMAKPPPPELHPDTGTAERPRPRTLVEAKMRQRQETPGVQRKQEGGVRRRLSMSSVDAKRTITGSYDSLLVDAISQRWYALLDEQADRVVGGTGEVEITFKLHSDGTITELKIGPNTTHNPVLGWLCYEAVHDVSTPVFQPWPEEMKRVVTDPRSVTFTFTYL